MIRLIVISVLIVPTLLWGEWRESKSVSLKKDAFERLIIKTDGMRRYLEFRWTLYSDGALVVHRSFDESVAQHVLKLNHTNQSFRIDLLPRTAHKFKTPYILVRFVGFDFEKHEGQFEIHLQDEEEEVQWENLEREE